MRKTPQRRGVQRLSRKLSEGWLVEAAGIEPASASPLPSDLHAYPAIYLTGSYPASREDRQPVQWMGFNGKILDKPCRDPVVDDSWCWTAQVRRQSEGSQDWFLSSESVVVVVGN